MGRYALRGALIAQIEGLDFKGVLADAYQNAARSRVDRALTPALGNF
jgi:hypothetical protein